jgi:mannan endo-1,4-beta-mannosidase
MKIRVCSIFVVLGTLFSLTYATPNFSIANGVLYDPDGVEFIPLGANAHGSNWVWPVYDGKKVSEQAESYVDVWKFTAIRLNCCFDGGPCRGYRTYSDNNNIDEIIENFTAKKCVVQLEIHNFTGGYPGGSSLSALADWHAAYAKKYIDNPYVWFNVMNEPGGSGNVSSNYFTVHKTVIEAIRATGNNNIIVCDGAAWGQDVGEWSANMVQEEKSGILKYGKDLFDLDPVHNVIFAFHTYDQWGRSGNTAKMRDYISRIKEKGLYVHIGEGGSRSGGDENARATSTGLAVMKANRLGFLAWHWQPGDNFQLLKDKRSGFLVNDPVAPTNLNWLGKPLWDYAHQIADEDISEKMRLESAVLHDRVYPARNRDVAITPLTGNRFAVYFPSNDPGGISVHTLDGSMVIEKKTMSSPEVLISLCNLSPGAYVISAISGTARKRAVVTVTRPVFHN